MEAGLSAPTKPSGVLASDRGHVAELLTLFQSREDCISIAHRSGPSSAWECVCPGIPGTRLNASA